LWRVNLGNDVSANAKKAPETKMVVAGITIQFNPEFAVVCLVIIWLLAQGLAALQVAQWPTLCQRRAAAQAKRFGWKRVLGAHPSVSRDDECAPTARPFEVEP
jgi:hypothetical protein